MKQYTSKKLDKALARISLVGTVEEAYKVLVHEAKDLFGAKDGAIILLQKESLEKVYESFPLQLEQKHHEKMHQLSTVLFENSQVFAPLQRGDHLIGVLVLQLPKQSSLDEQDKVALTLYAAVATLLIENQQLHKARTQELTDFMSYASHELRNPLTSLHGYIQLLYKKRPTEGKEAQWIEDLYQESIKFIALVKEMFDTKKLNKKN